MSASKVIDAIVRLTGDELPEGESVLVTKVPGGGMQVLRLRLSSTTMEHTFGVTTVKLEAHVLEEL